MANRYYYLKSYFQPHKEIIESKEKNAQQASTSALQNGVGIDPLPGGGWCRFQRQYPGYFYSFREMSEVLT